MTRIEQIEELRHAMWRNSVPTPTHNLCTCGRGIRGSGLCFDCAQQELAAFVGATKAESYAVLIRAVRAAEKEMETNDHTSCPDS